MTSPSSHNVLAELSHQSVQLEPFYVLDILKRAWALQAQGRDVILMVVGEPDFPTPAPVLKAGVDYLSKVKDIRYEPSLGIMPLRQAIADYYDRRFGINLSPQRVVVTQGGSGALALMCAVLLNPNDGLIMTEPYYPCNRAFVRQVGAIPHMVLGMPEHHFQPTVDQINAAWQVADSHPIKGILLASPSNPVGAMIPKNQLRDIANTVHQKRGVVIVDEIYQGLTYDAEPYCALSVDDRCWIVQSFSKYFNMTGWRLGWAILPESVMPTVEKLMQNLHISTSSVAQYAALAAFSPECLAQAEKNRIELGERRLYVLEQLDKLGFIVPVRPNGAFYCFADVSRFTHNSEAFALKLLEETAVAITPGKDFTSAYANAFVRFSYTAPLPRLKEAFARIQGFLGR